VIDHAGPARPVAQCYAGLTKSGGARFRHDKDWMGRSHLSTRRLEKVAAEASLHVLAYNIECANASRGVQVLIAAMHS
jgi:hypothetical protein